MKSQLSDPRNEDLLVGELLTSWWSDMEEGLIVGIINHLPGITEAFQEDSKSH